MRAYLNNRIYRYAGDCDITFFLGNIKGGIKDFQVSVKASSIKDIFCTIFNKNRNISDTRSGTRSHEAYVVRHAVDRWYTDILFE
jgi:hypothetical protein